MVKYKTVVTDYEGMQGQLDAHSTQGWRLFSVTPDTWRKSTADNAGMENSPFEELNTHGHTQEYSASYYLLIFQRDDTPDMIVELLAAEEALPASAHPLFEE